MIKNYFREAAHFDCLAENAGQIWWGSNTPAGKMRLRRRAELLAKDIPEGAATIVELACGTGAFTEWI